jgi:hypothetical protein
MTPAYALKGDASSSSSGPTLAWQRIVTGRNFKAGAPSSDILDRA